MPIKKLLSDWRVVALLLLAGFAARMAAASRGHNNDMEAYFIVAKITAAGGNVYAETTRYNYGPVWFLVVHGLDVIARHNQIMLRWLIAIFLSLADVGLFALLYRRAGALAATLFYLNPISILITGFHSQFDNFALLIGLLGVLQMEDEPEHPLSRRDFSGLTLLGLSLATKHDLFLLPFWLAVKRRGLLRKLVIFALPAAIFLAGFLPWWAGSHGHIMDNVFFYRSNSSSIFFTYLVPQLGKFTLGSPERWWLVILVLFAFISRTRDNFHSFLIYTGVLVAASPAMTDQYLAIPVALAAVCPNRFFLAYVLLGTVHLCISPDDLHLLPIFSPFRGLAVCSLCLAIVWMLWPRLFSRPLEAVHREIRIQFGLEK